MSAPRFYILCCRQEREGLLGKRLTASWYVEEDLAWSIGEIRVFHARFFSCNREQHVSLPPFQQSTWWQIFHSWEFEAALKQERELKFALETARQQPLALREYLSRIFVEPLSHFFVNVKRLLWQEYIHILYYMIIYLPHR